MKVEVMKVKCPKCGADSKQNKYHHAEKPATMSNYINCPCCGMFDVEREDKTS